MADVEKILRLVAEGSLTPEEADEILSALGGQPTPQTTQAPEPTRPANEGPRQLHIQVTERGRSVVNLRVPVSIPGWASAFLPGLSDEDSSRLRGAIASGIRGTLLDIGDEDDRVLITSE